jgi:ABC-type multidrug transport system fused ATPase/permease subunit
MNPFWLFASRMLRYRLTLVAAILCAAFSAGSLGVGLTAIAPILGNILKPPKEPELRDLAEEWNNLHPKHALPKDLLDKLPRKPVSHDNLRQLAQDFNVQPEHAGEQIPQDVIRQLPDTAIRTAQNLRDMASRLNAKGLLAGRIPQNWIDALPDKPYPTIVWIMCGLGVLTLIGGTFNFLHAFLSLTIIQRTVANIRREAFHRVLRLPLKDVVVGGVADKVNRILGDSAALENGFNSLLTKLLSQAFKGVASLGAALWIEWRMTIGSLLLGPLLYTIIRKLGKRIRRASKKAMQSQSGLLGAATEALQGLRVVKVHTTERYEAGRFHRINKEAMRQMFKARAARALSSPLVEALSIILLGGLFIIPAHAVIQNNLQPDKLITAFAALFAAGASLKPLTGLINDIQQSSASAARIQELLSAVPEPGHDKSLPRLGRHASTIEFKNVTFTYPGSKSPSLRDINLRVCHGQKIAVVGPNGSGKTTLLALVPRLFDPDDGTGAVLIDGQDIRDFSVRSVRKQIGVVTQETVLFRGTIRANIAYGAEDATEERIVAAARKARAHDFISSMAQGYDSAVGDQGLTLSGGQRQRIAIARAVLREPAILILDEATSMIDADSEAKIAEAVAEFSTGRTCLIVAHRLSTVINADRIVVMDQGRIVDQGTHAELLQRCETYRLIAQNQLLREK